MYFKLHPTNNVNLFVGSKVVGVFIEFSLVGSRQVERWCLYFSINNFNTYGRDNLHIIIGGWMLIYCPLSYPLGSLCCYAIHVASNFTF